MTLPPAIPFLDLRAAHAELQEELEAAAAATLRAGSYILGEQVAAFEAEFAAWLGVADAAGVASGTDALLLALRACDIGPDDEVLLPSHTAVATAAAVELSGARPVFVDIDPTTYTIDPMAAAAAITPRTRGLIAVHLYGQTAALEALAKLAAAHGLWLVEDCAQAHGAASRGRRAGSLGDIAAFSFYPTKNLGAAGDGGLVASNRRELVERVRTLRQYGWRERYISAVSGYNSRLDELQAALLRIKLRHLDEWNHRRQALAARYDQALTGSAVTPPTTAPGNEHVYHLYVVRTAARDALQRHLQRCGIGSAIHYPAPVHLQPAYRALAPAAGALAHTERIAGEILSLPLHPHLTHADAARVVEAVIDFANSLAAGSIAPS